MSICPACSEPTREGNHLRCMLAVANVTRPSIQLPKSKLMATSPLTPKKENIPTKTRGGKRRSVPKK